MKISNQTNFKKILITLSIVSLSCLIADYIPLFSIPNFTPTVLTFVFSILDFAPPIVLLLCAIKFDNSQKNSVLISVAYFIFATRCLLVFILNFKNFVSSLEYAFSGSTSFLWLISDIVNLLLPVALILAGCLTLKGKFSKAIAITPLALAVFNVLINIIIRLIYATTWGINISIDFISYLSDLALCAYLFVYGINNIPTVSILDKVSTLQPKEALVLLKNSFENGTITEEEYNAKRTEIIAKL